ncbi:hypothetical protein SAMN05518863_106182 [Candidatus Pantoea symbiotica]|uniref:Uncharacterized protein n=1 Tax=Candidatus Pantoea symbiotica TaxID=1884370 RepID=A0A1I3YQU4_9GAMM|nr:hypothetical protein SAMN05518863_106182 [Pantoea symbiotica]SFU86945.1 hypothetical protein SAMN05518864_106181 [Pantoea sp. YR525]
MQNGQNIVASFARVFYVMDGLKNNFIFNFANTREKYSFRIYSLF